MALTDEGGNGMVMPVSPMYAGGNNNNGGWGDGNGWWIILLLLLVAGGWNNGGGYGGGGNSFFPYAVNTGNDVQRGFDQSAIMGGIGDLNAGIYGIQNSLCNGFAGVNAAIANTAAQAEIAANSRQMANMNQMFNLSTQFADCCCENRLANCQTQNIIQNEGNATRFADANNTQNIIQSVNQSTRAVLDKLCQLELDGKNDRISELERQLTMANLAASQTAQTAKILADNTAQTTTLEQYLAPIPRPAYIVQNPNCCQQNTCGCGCG